MKKVFSILGMLLVATACQPQVADSQRPMERDRRPMERDRRPMERDRRPMERDRRPMDKDQSEMPGPTMRDRGEYPRVEEGERSCNPNDQNGRNASRVRMSERGEPTPGRYTPRYE